MRNVLKGSPDESSASWRKMSKNVKSRNAAVTPESSKVLRVAAYIRLSPTGDDREEGSMVSHPQRIKDFVELKNKQTEDGWGEIVEWYFDKDQSGKDLNRPGFQKLCDDIKLGLLDVVIVTELSRLSRRVKDFCHVWDFFKAHNVKFLSLKENFDTSTPMGELMLIQAIGFAQFERETIVERIKNGSRARAERGLANGTAPLGFDLVHGKANHRTVNPQEKAYVRFIFKKMLELKTIAKLQAYLNSNGYKTKEFTSGTGRKRGGTRWTLGSLHLLLTNRAYIGQREFNKVNKTKDQENLRSNERYFFTKAQWPALIDEKLFFEVQSLLEHNKKKARRYVYNYRLTGLVKCAECDEWLGGKSGTGRKNKYFYYGHSRKMTIEGDHHIKRCHLENIPAPQLEELVLERLKYLASDEKLLVQLVKDSSAGKSEEYKSINSLICSKENERREVANKLDNLIDAVASIKDAVAKDAIQAKLGKMARRSNELEIEIEKLRFELKKCRGKLLDASTAFKVLKAFNNSLEGKPAAVQAQILEDIVKEVVVYPERVMLKLYGTSSEEFLGAASAGGHLPNGSSRIQVGARNWN